MQFRTKLLSSTVLAAAAIVLAVPTASAQDIGALEKRVQALEKSGGGQNVTRTKKTVSLVISGHIYRAISFRDNGTTSGIVHITPNTSRTRVRWLGSGKVNDDLTIKTVIELGNSDNTGNSVSLGSADSGNAALDTRVLEIRLQSKSMGTVYLGQGYPAQAGTYGADFSGTGVISLNGQSARLVAGGELFQNAGASVGRTVISAFNVFDVSRRDRIRYDTPKFGGFQVRVDHQTGDGWGISANYGATLGGVKLQARIGHNENGQPNKNEGSNTNGSVALLLPMGLSVAFSAGQTGGATGTSADAAEYQYAKIGYKFKALDSGQTRLYADWHQMKDFANIGEKATSWGLGVVQIIEPLGAELVFAYHNIDLDLAAAAPSDTITSFTVGLRAKF